MNATVFFTLQEVDGAVLQDHVALGAAAARAGLDDDVAALMLTLPSTLGLFEQQILEVTQRVHDAGAQVMVMGPT